MIVYKDCFSFNIQGKEVSVYADETDYGLSSVLEIDSQYYYLSDQFPDLETVILAYQDWFKINLSDEEIFQIKESNKSC